MDSEGGKIYLGFKPEYQECESVGISSGGGVTMFNYNYAWNVEVGMRPFWKKSEQGYEKKPSWYSSCPYGYERSSWWNGKCIIPSDTKFLGESCSSKDQCHNDFKKKYVDTTCSPTTNSGDGNWKCMVSNFSQSISLILIPRFSRTTTFH